MVEVESSGKSEMTIRRTIPRRIGKTAGLLLYLGEPSKAVVERVAGQIGKFVPDLNGEINGDDFRHNAGSAGSWVCASVCSSCSSCSSCDCHCGCSCRYQALEDVFSSKREMKALRDRLNVRFGDIAPILEAFQRG